MDPLRPPLNQPGVQPPSPPPALPVRPVVVLPSPQATLPTELRPFGDVNPPRIRPPKSPRDARTWALLALRDHITGIQFFRFGKVGAPLVPMPLKTENFLIAEPGPNRDQVFPSVVCLQGAPEMIPIGFAVQPDESSFGRFGMNTVVVPQHTHRELVPLEVWGSTLEEVRSIVSGIESAMSPTEGLLGLRLKLPTYYGRTARFLLDGTEWPPDDENALRDRRRALVRVWLEVDVAVLYDATTMRPIIRIDVE